MGKDKLEDKIYFTIIEVMTLVKLETDGRHIYGIREEGFRLRAQDYVDKIMQHIKEAYGEENPNSDRSANQ